MNSRTKGIGIALDVPVIEHFLPVTSAGLWKALGTPTVTPALQQTLIERVRKEAGKRSVEEIADTENELLVRLLSLRAANANLQ
jgi:hypothetical protein